LIEKKDKEGLGYTMYDVITGNPDAQAKFDDRNKKAAEGFARNLTDDIVEFNSDEKLNTID
tara:strand:- start:209 stop:391 length:183 start_codon:yes stop_codon:yes gene_type:complete